MVNVMQVIQSFNHVRFVAPHLIHGISIYMYVTQILPMGDAVLHAISRWKGQMSRSHRDYIYKILALGGWRVPQLLDS